MAAYALAQTRRTLKNYPPLANVAQLMRYLGASAEVLKCDSSTFTVKIKMGRDGSEHTVPIEAVGADDDAWLQEIDGDDDAAAAAGGSGAGGGGGGAAAAAGGGGGQWPTAEAAAASQQAAAAAMTQEQYAAAYQEQYALQQRQLQRQLAQMEYAERSSGSGTKSQTAHIWAQQAAEKREREAEERALADKQGQASFMQFAGEDKYAAPLAATAATRARRTRSGALFCGARRGALRVPSAPTRTACPRVPARLAFPVRLSPRPLSRHPVALAASRQTASGCRRCSPSAGASSRCRRRRTDWRRSVWRQSATTRSTCSRTRCAATTSRRT